MKFVFVAFLLFIVAGSAKPLPFCSEMGLPIMMSVFPFIGPPSGTKTQVVINCNPFEADKLCTLSGSIFSVYLQWGSPAHMFAAAGVSESDFDKETGVISAYSNVIGFPSEPTTTTFAISLTLQQECDLGFELLRWDLVDQTFVATSPSILSVKPHHLTAEDGAQANQSVTLSMQYSYFALELSNIFFCAWQTKQEPVLTPAKAIEHTNTWLDNRKARAYDFECQVPPQFFDTKQAHAEHLVHLTYKNNTFTSANAGSILITLQP
jgi:hypothetical protein